MENRINQLTDTQQTCLRLVARNLSSKEIAIETGLSPQTVDQYLSKAATILGASNRREAARLLADWESAPFNKSEFKPDTIASGKKSRSMGAHADIEGTPPGRFRLAKWIPPLGGERHDLDFLRVLYAVLRVSVFTMGAAGAIIAVVFWLNRLAL